MNELFLILLASLIHELGHISAAKFVGVTRFRFSLNSFGALLSFDFSKTTYQREIFVHLAGAFTGIITSFIAIFLFKSSDSARFFAGVSLSLAIVNLLPIEGFDGGGVCRAFFSLITLPDKCDFICRITSVAFTLMLWTAAVITEITLGANLGLITFASTVLIIKITG